MRPGLAPLLSVFIDQSDVAAAAAAASGSVQEGGEGQSCDEWFPAVKEDPSSDLLFHLIWEGMGMSPGQGKQNPR